MIASRDSSSAPSTPRRSRGSVSAAVTQGAPLSPNRCSTILPASRVSRSSRAIPVSATQAPRSLSHSSRGRTTRSFTQSRSSRESRGAYPGADRWSFSWKTVMTPASIRGRRSDDRASSRTRSPRRFVAARPCGASSSYIRVFVCFHTSSPQNGEGDGVETSLTRIVPASSSSRTARRWTRSNSSLRQVRHASSRSGKSSYPETAASRDFARCRVSQSGVRFRAVARGRRSARPALSRKRAPKNPLPSSRERRRRSTLPGADACRTRCRVKLYRGPPAPVLRLSRSSGDNAEKP